MKSVRRYRLIISWNYIGITFNNGANWQAQRRFSMKVLRDFGFGKMSMISSIQDEIKELQGFLR